jgi:hypothetical protein
MEVSARLFEEVIELLEYWKFRFTVEFTAVVAEAREQFGNPEEGERPPKPLPEDW